MYTARGGSSRGMQGSTETQVVVKLKTNSVTRGAMRALATEGREPSKKGALDKWLASDKLMAMEPVFGKAPTRGMANFRRLAVAADAESDSKLSGLSVLSLPSTRDAKKACHEIHKDSLVEYAYIPPMKYVLSPRRSRRSDPLSNRQWFLSAINLFAAEKSARFVPARNVVVAVIDSGIDPDHPDLRGILIDNRSFTSGSKKDTSGHGTHVAGIIAAVNNNRIGVRGVTNSRRIMALKALDPYSAPGYYRAIRHATDNGAKVINFSLGGGHDPTEETLIKRALNKGVVVAAAMGNEKLEGNSRSFPAAIAGVIGVGASTETDGIANFSNTGTHIDLVAPGVNIFSTVPTYPSGLADGTDYEAWPGTSMATPQVAAAAALLLAKKPGASRTMVRKALVRGADKVPGQKRFNATFGHGRLNVNASLGLI